MIQEYILLQCKMTNRKLKDFGLNPFFGYILLLVCFSVFSYLLFDRLKFAEYVYPLIPVYLMFNLSETKRNDFLKRCFNSLSYKIIRIIENIIVSLPFVAFLLYKNCVLMSIILLIISVLSSLTNSTTGNGFVIATPFSKKPFEFTTGFRNTFYIFIFAYFLTGIAIFVDNFNLGIFSMILVYIIMLGYYTKPEIDYYVWIYNMSPKKFLMLKIQTALIYSSILSLPVILLLSIFYMENIGILLLCFLLGIAILVMMISAKYSAYPEEINIPELTLIGISLFFPPFLIAVIPYFLHKSIKQLNNILK